MNASPIVHRLGKRNYSFTWHYFYWTLAYLLFINPQVLVSQINLSSASDKHHLDNKVNIQKIDRDRWRTVVKNYNYTEISEKPSPERKRSNFKFPDIGLGLWPLKIIFFSLIIGLLAFVVYKLISASWTNKQTGIKEPSISLETIGDELEHADLERVLQQMLNEKNYKAAVRILYLLVIKELWNKQFINWKKDKTNFDYLSEMRANEKFAQFNRLTFLYELVWYGDRALNENEYQELSPLYRNFVDSVKA